jgi:toxin ParE1/3/4
MKRLVITPQAARDIEDIGDYIAQHNPTAARKLIERINGVFHGLSFNPLLGIARTEIREGMRSFPIGHYLILYRVDAEEILIVRLIDARRDLKNIL